MAGCTAKQGKHRFIVEVEGCSDEQAQQVIAERLGHDEDYGFDYTVGPVEWLTDPAKAVEPPIGGSPFAPHDGKDHRLDCWFCGSPAVVAAPRHTGGDEDVPCHFVPVCDDHAATWYDEVPDDERLPMLTLAGKTAI